MAQAAAVGTSRPFVAVVQAAQRPRARPATCSAVQQQQQQPEQQQLARRSLLAGLALFVASVPSQQSNATSSRWDGESSAIGSCELGEAGSECRQAILLKDKAKFASYESTAETRVKAGGAAGGVPVADMGDVYTRETIQLTDDILAYAAFADPADPARFKLIKEMKVEFPKWVSKYARGGSARKVSARKVYTVIDAISAHFANYGPAPLPKVKLNKLSVDINAARVLLAEGK